MGRVERQTKVVPKLLYFIIMDARFYPFNMGKIEYTSQIKSTLLKLDMDDPNDRHSKKRLKLCSPKKI